MIKRVAASSQPSIPSTSNSKGSSHKGFRAGRPRRGLMLQRICPSPQPLASTLITGRLPHSAQEKVALFRRLFRGREDIDALRWLIRPALAEQHPRAIRPRACLPHCVATMDLRKASRGLPRHQPLGAPASQRQGDQRPTGWYPHHRSLPTTGKRPLLSADGRLRRTGFTPEYSGRSALLPRACGGGSAGDLSLRRGLPNALATQLRAECRRSGSAVLRRASAHGTLRWD